MQIRRKQSLWLFIVILTTWRRKTQPEKNGETIPFPIAFGPFSNVIKSITKRPAKK